MSSTIRSATTQGGNGFSTINSKEIFGDKFPAVTVVECARNDFLPNVKLEEKAFECFLSYINLSLDLEEKFINLENEKGNYFFFFTLLSFIASCAEGIYASEAAVDNSTSSIKMGVESNILEDSGILINHEVILQCSNKESPKGPVEFTTTVTKIRKVCRSVLEVKGYKVFGDHRNSRYQLFAQLVVAMEKNMELTPLVKNTILGAFASGESVLFAKIDMDSTTENFCIRHTEIFAFRHKPGGSSIKVFNPENSKLVVELFFSMVMNDGKHRLISHSAMQTSIDKFRTESEANEFIRKGKIVHMQKMEQQLRESEEREEKRIQEEREYEERLRQEIKEREEKLSQKVRESEEREKKRIQEVREYEEKRSQQLREYEERLRQEIKEREKRLRKEGEMREKKRIQDLQKENKEREERLRLEREESEVREARLRLKIQDLQLLNSSKKRRRRAQKLAGPKRKGLRSIRRGKVDP